MDSLSIRAHGAEQIKKIKCDTNSGYSFKTKDMPGDSAEFTRRKKRSSKARKFVITAALLLGCLADAKNALHRRFFMNTDSPVCIHEDVYYNPDGSRESFRYRSDGCLEYDKKSNDNLNYHECLYNIGITTEKESGHEPISDKIQSSINEKFKINGIIDESANQGNLGDCWLLSCVNSLASSDKGVHIIRNSIIPNNDGTVNVKFAGAGKEYVITPEEIREHDTDDNKKDVYSNGDNDMLVLEIAMEKFMNDVKKPHYQPKKGWSIDGGSPVNLFKALAPNAAISKISNPRNIIVKKFLKQYFSNKENSAMTFSLYDKTSAQTLNKGEFVWNVNILGVPIFKHAFAVTNITKDTVSFTNPHYSKDEYIMTWDEFAKLKIDGLILADLSDS